MGVVFAMSAPFPNLYTHRKVAEASAKACDICYKPSTSVLITPDKKDFFYVCVGHLKDRYFCTPKIDEEARKKKREQAMAEETERVKKEYEEKQRKKKEKEERAKEEEEEEPRVFELKSTFYSQRLLKKRQAEAAKREKERISQPGYFPSVPTDLPTKSK